MKKPGAQFGVQPKNNLASDETPEFGRRQPDRLAHRTRAELRQSFYDFVQSTAITYSSASSPKPSAMPLSRSPSFGDDDLEFISSQTANMSLGPRFDSPFRSADSHNPEVIDLSHSPAPKAATPNPTFGHPTQLASRFGPPQRKNDHNNVFIQRKSRPELHRDLYRSSGPLKPKQGPKPLQMFSSMSETAQPISQYSQSAGSYNDQMLYTDPSKATADLKALLEGGMDEDEDEDDEAEEGNKDKGEEKAEKKETLEDGALEGITVKLLPHQVEGVKWMRGRELGPIKRGKLPKGGILADDMGLGKTLQSISLIISNKMPAPEDKAWKRHFEHIKKSTLVVAPLALIRQWEAEIKEKVAKSHALKLCVHHGPQRTKDASVLARYDVVITTYQILVSEHGHSSPEPSGLQAGCFGVHWYRVILDEAHSIKNRNAKATKAACALRSEYRWCLTGTPMQNNLDELQSLVNFLRIQPYDSLQHWRENIDKPMKQGKGHIAIKRLHTLLRCFMKRRTKDILKEEGALVAGGKKALDAAVAKAEKEGKEVVAPKSAFKITERKVVTVETQFSPAEKEFYDRLEERADASLEKMMKGKSVNYANALVLLLRLRQACNHPRLAETKIDKDRDALAADSTTQPKSSGADADFDALADAFGGMGIQTKECEMCLSDLSRQEVADGYLKCKDCVDGLEKLSTESPERKRVKKKSRRVSVVKEEVKIEKRKPKPKPARGRKIITDSDDEDEEVDGSWLVPEDKRGSLTLGVAGGTDDENAEGGGEDVGSEDSDHPSEEDGSQLDSFIVNDEPASQIETTSLDSEDDTFVSVSKIHSQPVQGSQQSAVSSALESDDDDDGRSLSESEIDSDSDSDSDGGSPSKRQHQRRLRNHGGSGGRKARNGGESTSHIMVSAKIRELLSILRKESTEHKFIVFSQFTSMLDLIEPFLRSQPGLKAVRYDGKMANDAREAALKALRTDPHTRILLCSLKCGSLGLNLTAATRVVIVEPFWNPFVEEQAIDRVHRLTQTVDVVVYKLTVAGTVEARILELQNKKRMLAEATIEGGMRKDKNALKIGLQEILQLFKHDARDGDYGERVGEGEFIDGPVVGQDVNSMAMMMGSKKSRGKRTEDAVYGRRW
ncbi:SNF2 family N-terminal domain-containing protein [Apodospora peruviana]|uniref:SNF2 family N-terminal domain-containing protein n=1 Tax=Apodospora peruviana TaxID=516989 RepID=A0AAE0I0I3_9PEZI|nr:SNF2 family N-terminal domain-containing protein [Apodospora peruviana]